MGTGEHSCDVPMELLIEIFMNLPLKSLIRLSVVCKSWFDLIRKDHHFAMRHYLARTRPSPTALMDNVDHMVEYFGKHGFRRGCLSTTPDGRDFKKMLCIHSLTPEKKTFRLLKKLEFGPRVEVQVSNILHGLLCVWVSSPSRTAHKLLLCNPAIREVVPLPLPEDLGTRSLGIIGFGFDPINNKYKVVALCPPSTRSGHKSWEVFLYSLRDGRWLSLPNIAPLVGFEMFPWGFVVNANGRVMNWIGHLKSNYLEKCLLSFDMVDEVFRYVPMPECTRGWHLKQILSSSGCEACFSCSPYLRNKDFNGIMDVWALNKDEDQQQMLWTKHSFPLSDDTIVPYAIHWMNDNELLLSDHKEEESKVEVCHYDFLADQLKKTGRFGRLRNPDGYTESLISTRELMSSSPASALYLQAMRDEHEKEGDEVCFIREVGRKNTHICWSYTFKLVQY